MGKKKVTGILLISLIVANLFNPFFVNAQVKVSEPLVLSLEVAQEKALHNVYSIKQVNRQIGNLLKRNDYTYNDGDYTISDVQKTIDSLYTRLKNGKAMYSQEVAKIYVLYTMYGDTPYFGGKEDITKHIILNNYPKYTLWGNVMKQSIRTQIIEINIKNQTSLFYNNILSTKEQFDLLKKTIAFQEKTFKQLKSRYNLGEVSKVSFETAEKQLQIKKLEMRKLSRTIDNLEMDLKELTAVPINTKIVLKEYSANNKEQLESYDTYLNSALINRNEIVTAKIDYWVCKNDLYIANNAFSNNPWNINTKMSKGYAQQKLNEAELLISDSKELVLQNINDAYIDVKYKKEEMNISRENLDYANKQYKNSIEKYKKKLISENTKTNEEINSLQALLEYNDAVRTYNFALYRLQQASKLGVAY